MSIDIQTFAVADVRLRAGVKALVQVGDRVLLVKEMHSDGTPFWTLPGGGVKDDESPVAALERELEEELHCEIDIIRTVGQVPYAHMSSRRLSVYTVFDCDLCSAATPNVAEGVFDIQWAHPERLPPKTLFPIRHLIQRHDSDSRSRT